MSRSDEIISFFSGVALVASVAGISPAWSQSTDVDEPSLDEVVVVAHKNGRPVSDIAANVTVLTRADIDNSISASFADVFRYTPGVDYESAGTRFGGEGINIRGISGNRVAMLVDGVPLSDQFDVGSFSNATRDFVNAGLVERIEVLHGPASALYGSSAIGGVVAVRTPDPADLLGGDFTGGNVMATYKGADSSAQGTGMLALGSSELGVLFAGSIREGEQTDAAAADEPLDFRNYSRRSALAKLVANDRLNNTWTAEFIRQDSEVQSDLNSMLGGGRYRSTTALVGDDEYVMNLAAVSFEFGDVDSWVDAGTVRAYYQDTTVEQTTLDERGGASRPVAIDRFFSFEQQSTGIELNLQKTLSGRSVEHQLGFGVQYRHRLTEEYRDGLETGLDDGVQTPVLLGEVFPLRDFPISESDEWGAYIEDVMSIGNWSLIAALRADSYEMSPQEDAMYAEDYPFAQTVSLSESHVSPKLGLIYHFSSDTELYVQYSHGFRAPPYEDANIGLEIPLFNYRAVPNPDLKSESSDGIDLGIRWRGSDADLRFGVFHTRYDDFIESKMRIGTDPESGRVLFQSQNLRQTVIEGVEGGGSYRFSGAMENFSVDGSFYWARGENKESGEPLNSVGPGQLVTGIAWASVDSDKTARLQATFSESWSRRDESRGELFKPAGYSLFDFFYSQRLGDRVTARLGLLNLTDKTYWRWTDVRGLSPNDPVIPYLSQAGRSVSLSVNVNWN